MKQINLRASTRSSRLKEIIPKVNNLFEKDVVVFLIHGYNNKYESADDSYMGFENQLTKSTHLADHDVIAVHWPGNYFKNPLLGSPFYPKIVKRAKASAETFSHFLKKNKLKLRGKTILLVAHSLGCRVTIEILSNLYDSSIDKLDIGIFLMAAAIPYETVLFDQRIADGLTIANLNRTIFFSDSDRVLKYTFRPGQMLAWNERFSEAVGLHGRPFMNSWTERIDKKPYRHGDYWKSTSVATNVSETINRIALNGFTNRSVSQPREIR